MIGRVAGIRGRVYAQTPGEPRRLLVENAPIYPGDRLVTSGGAQLGVLSGAYYTGLDEQTTVTYSKLGSGAPSVSLEHGDVRVINSGEGENARIATPGLLAATATTDTTAHAIKEKAWVVSMVCAVQGQVQVSGGADGRSLSVKEGGCAASKPAEGIFMAGAAGVPLAVVPPVPVGAVAAAPGAAAPLGAAGAAGAWRRVPTGGAH